MSWPNSKQCIDQLKTQPPGRLGGKRSDKGKGMDGPGCKKLFKSEKTASIRSAPSRAMGVGPTPLLLRTSVPPEPYSSQSSRCPSNPSVPVDSELEAPNPLRHPHGSFCQGPNIRLQPTRCVGLLERPVLPFQASEWLDHSSPGRTIRWLDHPSSGKTGPSARRDERLWESCRVALLTLGRVSAHSPSGQTVQPKLQ